MDSLLEENSDASLNPTEKESSSTENLTLPPNASESPAEQTDPKKKEEEHELIASTVTVILDQDEPLFPSVDVTTASTVAIGKHTYFNQIDDATSKIPDYWVRK